MDMTVIIWGMFFGIIGLAYFRYGKKQQAWVPFFTGIALFFFPYFISNVYVLVSVGAALVAVPFFVKI